MSRKATPIVLMVAAVSLPQTQSARAALTWKWIYNGAGISAVGTLTTSEKPE